MLLPAVWQNNKRKSSAPTLEAKRKRIQHDEEREERAIDEIACIIEHALQGQPEDAQLAPVDALRIDVHSILNDIPFERLLSSIATRDAVRALAFAARFCCLSRARLPPLTSTGFRRCPTCRSSHACTRSASCARVCRAARRTA